MSDICKDCGHDLAAHIGCSEEVRRPPGKGDGFWPCGCDILPDDTALVTTASLDAALINHQHDPGAPLTIRSDHLAAQTFRSCAAAIIEAAKEAERE